MKKALSRFPAWAHAVAGGVVAAGLTLAPHIDGHIANSDWLAAVLAFLGGAGLTSYTVPPKGDA